MIEGKKFFRVNKAISKELFLNFKNFLLEVEAEPDIGNIVLMFDTKGGDVIYAVKIVKLMKQSRLRFISVALGKVDSVAALIFLSAPIRFGYQEASALIHRAVKNEASISNNNLKKSEKQIFKIIAEKLLISIREVYEMANKVEGTIIDMSHPLGKTFFMEW